MSGGMTSTTFKIMSYTLNTSRTTVNEGESIVFTADLSNAKRYDPNTPHPTWGWLGHFVPFKAGDNVELYLSYSEAGRTDFVGDQGSWSMTLGDDLLAQWTVTVKADEMTEGEEIARFDFNDDTWWLPITISDTSKTPTSNGSTTIINNSGSRSVINNGGVIMNGDNNGTISFGALNNWIGSAGDDSYEGSSSIAQDDQFYGGDGNDALTGHRGSDSLFGENGDDILRAGNGKDEIFGGAGMDEMYGGFGRNTFGDARDGTVDSIFFKSDQFADNWVYGSAGNSPNGEKADIFEDSTQSMRSLSRV